MNSRARDASSLTESQNDLQNSIRCSQIAGMKFVVAIAKCTSSFLAKGLITCLLKISKQSFKVDRESLVVFSVASLFKQIRAKVWVNFWNQSLVSTDLILIESPLMSSLCWVPSVFNILKCWSRPPHSIWNACSRILIRWSLSLDVSTGLILLTRTGKTVKQHNCFNLMFLASGF